MRNIFRPVNLLILYSVAILLNMIMIVTSTGIYPIWVNVVLIIIIIPGYIESYKKLREIE